jgi:hypothetical protein
MNITKITEFQKLWGALLEPLPELIATLEQKDELTRQVAALELRRQQSIDAAREGVEQLTQTAERLTAEVKALNLEKMTATNDLSAHRKACAAEVASLNASVTAAAADVKRQVEVIKTAAAEAEKEKVARLRAVEEAHAAEYARMEREVVELEGRRKAAEDSLSRLKARLEG